MVVAHGSHPVRSPGDTIQRLAVIDPIGNVGGGSRFAGSLLPALARCRPGLQVTFYGRPSSMQRDALDQSLPAAGVEVVALEWVPDRAWAARPMRTRLRYRVRRALGRAPADFTNFINNRLKRELEAIGQGFDLVYIPWPYRIPIPAMSCPVVSTIHDLNFQYFFGTPIFAPALARSLNQQLDSWLAVSTVVTSSDFMAGEIARFYPGKPAASVVRLAPFAGADIVRDEAVLSGLGLDPARPYILCANNVTAHKNIGSVIAALAILRETHGDLRLVVAGAGTEQATGTATPIGTIRTGGAGDVIGLGYVSNDQIDQLIAGAAVAVNSSFYEGGNGSGLDAWRLGTPVAMSDIPPFREHLDALGVEAALFDPRSPADIAAKVADIVDRPAHWADSVERSRRAIGGVTWDGVAAAYLEVFDAAFRAARG